MHTAGPRFARGRAPRSFAHGRVPRSDAGAARPVRWQAVFGGLQVRALAGFAAGLLDPRPAGAAVGLQGTVRAAAAGVLAAAACAACAAAWAGVRAPYVGRAWALGNPAFDRAAAPALASLAEHQVPPRARADSRGLDGCTRLGGRGGLRKGWGRMRRRSADEGELYAWIGGGRDG